MLILQMVSDGKITPEQGNDLLRAVSQAPPATTPAAYSQAEADIAPEAGFETPAGQGWQKERSLGSRVVGHSVSGLGDMLAKVIGHSFRAGTSAGRLVRKELKGELPEEGILDVTLSSANGAIKVQAWDQPGFCLEAIAKLNISSETESNDYLKDVFSFVHDGCVISAKSEMTKDLWWKSPSLGFVLSIPKNREATLCLSSQSGRIVIENVCGPRLRASTANGRICVSGADFSASDLNTANGRIEYDGKAQKLNANTANGRIEANLTGVGEWQLRSSNGRIQANIKRTEGAGYEVDATTLVGKMEITGFDDVLLDESNRKSGTKRYKAKTADSHGKAGVGYLNISNVVGRISVTV